MPLLARKQCLGGGGDSITNDVTLARFRDFLTELTLFSTSHCLQASSGTSAWDLLTGKRLEFALERSYGCGIVAGSRRTLLFRSATLSYRNLEGPGRTENYEGIRPGCWIAAIPAGGLVLMADAASWCTCSYLNQASVALQPATGSESH